LNAEHVNYINLLV